MNKKDAEAEAIRKTKEAQHAAGKNTGMSGRDLVRRSCYHAASYIDHEVSSNTTQNGSKTRTTGRSQTSSIFRNTDVIKRRYTQSFGKWNREIVMCLCMAMTMPTGVVVAEADQKTSSCFSFEYVLALSIPAGRFTAVGFIE
jgi:hypothetical protein